MSMRWCMIAASVFMLDPDVACLCQDLLGQLGGLDSRSLGEPGTFTNAN